MATLRNQFNDALTNIEINGRKAKRAQEAHQEIREVLEADAKLKEWGVDTKLIGSYSRDTGIYPGKDVDVFVKLTLLTTSALPKEVYDEVWRVLRDRYGDAREGGRASQQARSIKVAFPDDDFAVDSVPAVRDGARWAIPAKDRNRWVGSTGRWVTTDPERFGDLSSALSTSSHSPAVGGRHAYKPIVKLMRQTRHIHLGDARPGGLYIEFATYELWYGGLVAGADWDPLLAQTLRGVATRLESARYLPLVDPALGTTVEPALPDEELKHAAEVFRGLADSAELALQEDDCKAAVRWREILGGNERAAFVFPLPPGCAADGRRIGAPALIAPARRSEAHGFG
jgi:hypothetical protein